MLTGHIVNKINAASKHPLFEKMEQEKLFPKQLEMFIQNYAARTKYTAIFIAQLLTVALKDADYHAAHNVSKNLHEEMGENIKGAMHPELLQKSLNTFLTKFGLKEISLKTVEQSPLIIDETRTYIKQIGDLYLNNDIVTGLSISLAHETEASNMLTNIRQGLAKYKSMFTDQEWGTIDKYFQEHLDNGVEEGHSQDAIESITPYVNSDINKQNIEQLC